MVRIQYRVGRVGAISSADYVTELRQHRHVCANRLRVTVLVIEQDLVFPTDFLAKQPLDPVSRESVRHCVVVTGHLQLFQRCNKAQSSWYFL